MLNQPSYMIVRFNLQENIWIINQSFINEEDDWMNVEEKVKVLNLKVVDDEYFQERLILGIILSEHQLMNKSKKINRIRKISLLTYLDGY